MKSFLTLTKLNFRYYVLPDFKDKKERKKYIILLLFIGLCFIFPIAGLFISLYSMALLASAEGGLVNMLSAMFTVSQLMVLFMSAFTYISSMFFAKDNEILLNLPVSHTTIFSSKLVVSYFNELLISTIIVLPTTVITLFAVNQNGLLSTIPVGYYLLIPVAVILLPLLPLLVLSVISFPIAAIVQKLSKKPVIGAIIQAVFLIAFVAGIYYVSYSFSYSASADQTLDISSIFEPLAKINVFTTMLAKAMLGVQGWANLAGFVASMLAFGGAAIGLSVLMYKKALQLSAEGGGSTMTKISHAKTDEKQEGQFKAFFKANVRHMFRDNNVTVNTIMTAVMPSVLVFFMIFMGAKSVESAMQQDAQAAQFSTKYFSLAMSLMMSTWFCAGTNVFATIGFSLERENFAVLKTMPIPYSTVFNVKWMLANAISVISCLAAAIVTVIMAKLSVFDFIGLFVFTSIYCVSINAFSLGRDVRAPKLTWMTMKELTKNNFHTVIPMLVSLAGSLPVMIVSFIAAFTPSLTDVYRSLMIWGTFALVDVVFALLFALKPADKTLRYYEETEA